MTSDYSALSAKEINNIFDEAKRDKKWDIIKTICDLDAEIRPLGASKETLLGELKTKKQWGDVFLLELAFKEHTYEVTPGPLPKSSYTDQLEELTRDIMTNPASFDVKEINHQSIIFVNSKTYNWTTIITHADLDHIELTQQDCNLFKQFKNRAECPASKLIPEREAYYKERLYQHGYRNTKTPHDERRMITFPEMEAINIYTRMEDYKRINSLLRTTSISTFGRSDIVLAVLCASGLRKLPGSPTQDAYRAINMRDDEIGEYIHAAAQRDVVFLSGFVSTSTGSVQPHFEKLPVHYHFTGGVRGVDIDPISANLGENEILLPPTKVQFSSYQFKNDKHHFEATVCTDLESIKTVQRERYTSPLHLAVKQGDIDTIEQYAHKGFYINNELLFIAAFYGQMDAVASLVRLGCDINQPDNQGLFPMSVATYFNPADIIDVFVALGADVNFANKKGQTPIFDAAAHGQIEVIKKLSNLHADFNKTDHRGETAIFTAIRHHQVKAIEAMLSLNTMVTNPNNNGEHCIFLAIRCDREDTLAVFVRFRVGLDVLDDEGNTPLLHAIKGGYANAARYLLTNGYITISTDLIKDMEDTYENSGRYPNIRTLIEEIKEKFEEHQEITQEYRQKVLQNRSEDPTDTEHENANIDVKKPFDY